MRPFLSKSDNEEMQSDYRYCLYAVVNHLGSIDAGHYTGILKYRYDKLDVY